MDLKNENLLENDDKSPGHHFISTFQSMHNLIEKLILLDYAKEFCPKYKSKLIHRYYFSIQTNPGEQFYIFSCLCGWLIKDKCKLEINNELNPQDYEDPNVTINAILDAISALHNTTFSPAKLKQGYGIEVINILNILADDALSKNYTPSKSITIKGIINNEQDDIFDENDNLDGIEMDFNDTLLEEDEGEELMNNNKEKSDILLPKVDIDTWKLEYERVLPQLKVVLHSSDLKTDWRNHINEMHKYRSSIDTHLQTTIESIEKLTTNINWAMEKINGRENYLQLQLETLINEYNSLKNNLNQVNENYKLVSGGVTDKSRILADISEQLDNIKEEMEERGTSMTDGTPLINLRKSYQRIKTEITTIDIRIGVALHTLLQAKLQETTKDTLDKQLPNSVKSISLKQLSF